MREEEIKPYDENEKPLTVGELISILEKLDPNKPIYTNYTDHTDWEYRTPLRGVEVKEMNVGVEREVSEVGENDWDVDYVDTDIVNIEFVEHFEF